MKSDKLGADLLLDSLLKMIIGVVKLLDLLCQGCIPLSGWIIALFIILALVNKRKTIFVFDQLLICSFFPCRTIELYFLNLY